MGAFLFDDIRQYAVPSSAGIYKLVELVEEGFFSSSFHFIRTQVLSCLAGTFDGLVDRIWSIDRVTGTMSTLPSDTAPIAHPISTHGVDLELGSPPPGVTIPHVNAAAYATPSVLPPSTDGGITHSMQDTAGLAHSHSCHKRQVSQIE